MMIMPVSATRGRFADWPVAVKSILGFWLFYAVTVVARALLGRDPVTVLQNKSVTVATGVILTFGVYAAIASFAAGASLRRRIVVALVSSFVAAAALSGILIAADRYQDKPQDEFRYVSTE